jgi:putative cardiolipin synthase
MFTITENSVAIANRSCLIPDVFKAWMSLLLIGFVLAGCATLPTEYPRQPSTAITDYPATSLDQLFEKDAAQHPGESGFAIIRHGRQAFTARVALTDLAEKSLDVHPNIEIRIFNPFANRGARLFDFAIDFDRVNHRMHNKFLVADNAVAIVGGRNISNHYFGVATDANFRGLDIAAAGPVVRDASTVFDHFWNSDWAVTIKREPSENMLRQLHAVSNKIPSRVLGV